MANRLLMVFNNHADTKQLRNFQPCRKGLLVPNNQVMYNPGTGVVKRLEEINGQTTQVTQATTSDIVNMCRTYTKSPTTPARKQNNVLLNVNTIRNVGVVNYSQKLYLVFMTLGI